MPTNFFGLENECALASGYGTEEARHRHRGPPDLLSSQRRGGEGCQQQTCLSADVFRPTTFLFPPYRSDGMEMKNRAHAVLLRLSACFGGDRRQWGQISEIYT